MFSFAMRLRRVFKPVLYWKCLALTVCASMRLVMRFNSRLRRADGQVTSPVWCRL